MYFFIQHSCIDYFCSLLSLLPGLMGPKGTPVFGILKYAVQMVLRGSFYTKKTTLYYKPFKIPLVYNL